MTTWKSLLRWALFSFYKYKNEQRKFNNLEKLSEKIEKSLDERIDTMKLTIAETKLDKLKKAYRASKTRLEEN